MDRRKFVLGGLLVGAQSSFGHPVLRLIDAIAKDVLRKANADDSSVLGARNYLNIGFFGAPARYTFDGWLRTNDSDASLVFNPMTATALNSSGGVVNGGEYRTVTYKGLMVPAIFGQSVSTSSGSVPLTNFLDQMLVIRGYGTGVDGHPQNFNAQQKPLAGKPSISGLAADSSNRFFEAIQYRGRGDYNAFYADDVALNLISGSTPLAQLFDGIESSTTARKVRSSYVEAIDLARARIKAAAGTQNNSSIVARKSMDNAVALIKQGVGDITSFWNEAYSRYFNIIHNAARASGISGVSDAAIVASSNSDLLTRVSYSDQFTFANPGFDLRQMTSTMIIGGLAEGLALAEFVFANNYVTSLEISADSVSNVLFQPLGSSPGYGVVVHDMHGTGAYVTTLMTTALFRGVMAGLLELRTRLQAATCSDGSTSVWSRTVTHLMGDFNRSARADGSGSDHGYNQMVTSIFSGAFDNGPIVVGNVAQNAGAGTDYSGSQGVGAEISGYSQSGIPTPLAMASTVSQLLDISENPWQNLASPLVTLANSTLSMPYGKGKVIG